MSDSSFVGDADVLDWIAPAYSPAGTIVNINGTFGHVFRDTQEGELIGLPITGSIVVAKKDGAVFTEEDNVYWDATEKHATDVEADGDLMGRCSGGADADDEKAIVRLNQ